MIKLVEGMEGLTDRQAFEKLYGELVKIVPHYNKHVVDEVTFASAMEQCFKDWDEVLGDTSDDQR